MKEQIATILAEVEAYSIENKEQLEQFRLKFLVKKSALNELFTELRNVPAEDKRVVGGELNILKNTAQNKFKEFSDTLESAGDSNQADIPDLTLPITSKLGTRHPITLVREEIIQIFERMGFNLSDGPEIEDDWHNFTALNFPENHPAREMQDTFFLEKNPDIALRTHTSSIQVRVMEKQQPPIRTLAPGRVFRNEAISARAHCVFHQIEGFYIDENVSFVDLKQTLYHFAKEMFSKETKIRFRPSFFPFTEPN
jgi:phenylalanyl-tRNA synthetase alpha chain